MIEIDIWTTTDEAEHAERRMSRLESVRFPVERWDERDFRRVQNGFITYRHADGGYGEYWIRASLFPILYPSLPALPGDIRYVCVDICDGKAYGYTDLEDVIKHGKETYDWD
jgi:hypothetical protein